MKKYFYLFLLPLFMVGLLSSSYIPTHLNYSPPAPVWEAIGPGLNNDVWVINFDGSNNLYAGGDFLNASGDDSADKLAWFNGTDWVKVVSAAGYYLDNSVYAMAFNGTDLYAGGRFLNADNVADADFIAKWNGAWTALGATPLTEAVKAIAIDGSGNIYAGGMFLDAGGVAGADHLAKWDGTSWSALGTTPLNGNVWEIVINGSDIYIGGDFTDAGGLTDADYVAKFNTVTSTWSALSTGVDAYVRALELDGNNLYIGGNFNNAGGNPAAKIVRYSISDDKFFAMGTLSSQVWAIEVDGSTVYAGGDFTNAGGDADADFLAQWNGSAWSAVLGGLSSSVYEIEINSGYIYVGGNFVDAGSADGDHIVRLSLASLSVELLSFSGQKYEEDVMLKWTTSTQINNAYFEIQHSFDGKTFHSMARIEGAGNTQDTRTYQYKHLGAGRGMHYYRLKQVDFNGNYEFSNVISVKMDYREEIAIYPNPTSGILQVKTTGQDKGKIRILNHTGQLIKEQWLHHSGEIDLTGHPNGVYLIELQIGAEKVVRKVTKR